MKFVITFRHRKARDVHVKVVDIEEDDAAAIERNRAIDVDCCCPARGGKLTLFIAARDKFKRLNGAWLAVDAQLEVVASGL